MILALTYCVVALASLLASLLALVAIHVDGLRRFGRESERTEIDEEAG